MSGVLDTCRRLVARKPAKAGVPVRRAGSANVATSSGEAELSASLGRHGRLAIVAFVALFGVFGGWASMASISGAVIAEGRLVLESSNKVIKHREGGIVREILVSDGDIVAAGDVLLYLDGTSARSELGVIETRLVHTLVRSARLKADAAQTDMAPPENWHGLDAHPEAREVIDEETFLLNAIRVERDAERAGLMQRRARLEEEVHGHEARRRSAATRLEIASEQLEAVRPASESGHVARSRLQELRARVAELEGEIGMASAAIASAGAEIASTDNDLLRLNDAARANSLAERRELEETVLELLERRHAAADVLRRSEIRAPNAGIVRSLSVHSVGAVLAPGEPIMTVVPSDDRLVVEARLRPLDIDQVSHGQAVEVRFPGLDIGNLPGIEGKVLRIDADLTHSEDGKSSYYLVRVAIEAGALRDELGAKLVAGMPAQLFLATGERSPMSYMLQPLIDQFSLALREG